MSLLLLAAIGLAAAVTKTDLGNGDLYRLSATQDAWLERSTSNYGTDSRLLVGFHPGFPKKRFLAQFENLPGNCTKMKWAKMYVHFWYAHKASFQSVSGAPYIVRDLQVRQVKRSWSETEVTSIYRSNGVRWNQPYLAIDGTDAQRRVQDTVTIFTGRPAGYIEFDITKAMRSWMKGRPNYGLLVLATNEGEEGRDLRFYSRNASENHPYVNVLCDYDTE